MSGWPPLPPEDHELEDLLSEHVEIVAPPAALVDRTHQSVQRQLQPRGGLRWLAVGGALLALIAVGLALMPDAPPEPKPEAPLGSTPAPSEKDPAPPSLDPLPPPLVREPSPTAAPSPSASLAPPVPAGELLVPLQGRPAGFQADKNYDLLKEQLGAPLIVTGRIERTGTEVNRATLRVARVLRGKRAMLVRVSASKHVNACMGVPDFTRFDGKDVVLFLRVNKDGSTSLLTGGASLRPLPYHGLLDTQALGAIVRTRRIPGPQLAAVVRRRGARSVTWLSNHLPTASQSIRAPEVQAALLADLRALPAEPDRRDVMGIAEHLIARPALAAAVLDRLKRYHTTFQHRLGNHTRLPNGQFVNNGYRQHLTFVRFVSGFDRAWATGIMKWTLARIDRGSAPRVYGQYQAALAAVEGPAGTVKASLTARPEGGSVFEISGTAPHLPDGTLVHVTLEGKQTTRPHADLAFFMVRVKNEAFRARKVYKTQTFPPMNYEARVDLIVSSQRKAIRAWIVREFGLRGEARCTVGQHAIAVGTEQEQEAFRKKTREDLVVFAATLAKALVPVAKQVRDQRIDPAGRLRLQRLRVPFQDYLSKRVGWPQAVAIKQLRNAFAEAERALVMLQRGQQGEAKAGLARADASLEAAQRQLGGR